LTVERRGQKIGAHVFCLEVPPLRTLRTAIVFGPALLVFLAACGNVVSPEDTTAPCPAGYVCIPASGTPTSGSEGGGGTSTTPSTTTSQGTGGSGSGTLPLSWGAARVLDYRVVDAAFSDALSAVVLVSDSPSNALHIVDIHTGNDRAVSLPLAPIAVTVDLAGAKAAVAYDAHVSSIDLAAGTLTKTCNVSSDAYDVALSSKGVAYVMPRTDQWVELHAIDLSSCAETASASNVRAASRIGLHPSESALFAADQGLSPSRVDRCDLSSGTIACTDAQGQADWGTYEYCGNLWISADGARIYTGCGVTLRVPGSVNGSPCTYGGTLGGVTGIQHLSEAPQAGRVVFVPALSIYCQWGDYDCDPDADAVIRVHETDFLGLVGESALPPFPLSGTKTAVAHGRFVFTTPDMSKLVAVVQADASSGALHDYAIVTSP
jgi:hypothetical protein